MDKNRYCVIMAGGQGTRLWPMSRKAFPKQFQDPMGCGKTLLQQTYERYARVVPPENIIISTNVDYKAIVKKELMYNKNVSEKVRALSKKLEVDRKSVV